MFAVYYKTDDNYDFPVTVLRIRDDKNGYPHFLIYENGEWKYVSAKKFKDLSNTIKTRFTEERMVTD